MLIEVKQAGLYLSAKKWAAEPSLINFLEKKRCNADFDKMDFKDYHARVRAESGNKTKIGDAYLDSIFEKFFDGLRLGQLAARVPTS